MTNEEKFAEKHVLYKDKNGDYILELWGGSTKHPDSVFFFSKFEKFPYLTDEQQLFQWVCECASKLIFPTHAKELIEWAIAHYDDWLKK